MQQRNHRKVSKFVIIFIGILIPILSFSYLVIAPVFAATSDTINLQGKIVRNDPGYEGLNVTAGNPSCVIAGSGNDTCDFRIRYYDSSSGGTLLLTEQFSNVEIGQYMGVFNLALGSDPFPTAGTYVSLIELVEGESNVYVEVGFDPAGGNSYTEVFTRMPLQATAYAIRAKYADNTSAATEVPWSGLQDPTADLTIEHTTRKTLFNWATGTGTNDLFSLTSDASATGTGSLLNIQTGIGSGLTPLRVRAGSTEAIFVDSQGRVGVGTTTPGATYKVDVVGNTNLSIGSAYYIGETSVLSGTTLGSTVVSSSLTSVGTLTSGTWNANTITVPYGGTGATSFTAGRLLFGNESSAISEDSNLHWDNTNKRLGLGLTNPGYRLHVDGGVGIVAQFSGRVIGADAVNTDEFVTKSQLDGVSSSVVSSVTGITNQITANPTTGNVLLSLPSTLIAPGTFNAVTSISTGSGTGTVRIDASGNLSNIGTISSTHLTTGATFVNLEGASNELRINNTSVLTSTTLGSTVVYSSLESVGTLTSGTWNASTITVPYGGTGATNFTAGRLLFGNGTGAINEDSNLHWDNTNKRLGVGTTTPSYALHVNAGTGIVGQFSGRVIGGDAVNSDEFVTKSQLDGVSGLPSGADGQTLRHNGTAWIPNSFLFNNGTSIGIGTTSPGARLEVTQAGTTFPGFWGDNQKLTGTLPSVWFRETTTNTGTILGQDGGKFYFMSETAGTVGEYIMTLEGGGNVGIGTGSSTLSALFSVGLTSQFRVDSSGDIIRIKDLAYSWPTAHTANGFLKNNGTGGLSWTEINAVQKTGTPFGDAGGGQVSFWSGSDTITGDDNLYWDNTQKFLGIGTTSPTAPLDIAAAGGLGSMIKNSSGDITIEPAANLIISQGNVGIGTDLPLGKLHVKGSDIILKNEANETVGLTLDSGLSATQRTAIAFKDRGTDVFAVEKTSTNAFQIYDFLNSGVSRFLVEAGGNSGISMRTVGTGSFNFINGPSTVLATILSNGNVGIGTSSPGTRLNVHGDQTTNRISQSGGTYTELAQRTWGGNAGILFSAYASDSYVDGGLTTTGNTKYKFDANVYGVSSHAAKMILAGHSTMEFFISPSSTGADSNVVWGTPIMRLEGTGNVGIGTTSPGALLHVATPSSGSTVRFDTPATGNPTMLLGRATGQPSIKATNALDWVIIDGGKVGLNYWQNSDVILANGGGNVGIGNASPSYKLDVSGTGRFTGTLGVGTTPNASYAINASGGTYGIWATGSTMGGRFVDSDGTSTTYAAYGGWGIYTAQNGYFGGNVGIGNASPSYKLQVTGTSSFSSTANFSGLIYASNRIYLNNASNSNSIEVGHTNLTGNYSAYIDFTGDTTYSDYGFRIIRGNTGPNTTTQLLHRGTGDFYVQTVDAGAIRLRTNSADRLTVTSNGNVGIGMNPSYKLDVSGVIRSSSEIISSSANAFRLVYGNYGAFWRNDGSTLYLLLTNSGNQYGGWNSLRPMMVSLTTGYVTFGQGHGDLAENYEISGTALRGSLVSVESSTTKKAIVASSTNSGLIGVISTKPGAVMDVDGGFNIGSDTKPVYTDEKAPVALTGVVPVLVSLENGDINPGDAIGISTVPGYGAKILVGSESVGNALEGLNSQHSCQAVHSMESIEWPEDDGKNTLKPCFKLPDGSILGKILVAVSVTWYDPNALFVNKIKESGIVDVLRVETETTNEGGSKRSLLTQAHILPSVNNTYDLGTSTNRWKDIYTSGTINIGKDGDSGGIKYDTESKRLKFTNDGQNWIGLGAPTKEILLSAQYPGSVVTNEAINNVGIMSMGSTGIELNSMNYYEWNSTEVSLNSTEVKIRYQIPSDFKSWGNGGITFNYSTQSTNTADNKIDFYVYDQSSTVPENLSVNNVSTESGKWETMKMLGLPFNQCSNAGDVCMFVVKLSSSNDNSVKVGDIKITYERNL